MEKWISVPHDRKINIFLSFSWEKNILTEEGSKNKFTSTMKIPAPPPDKNKVVTLHTVFCNTEYNEKNSICSAIAISKTNEITGNNSYNNLKLIPIWKICISHTFPQALGVSRRTFDSNNLCCWLSNFRVNPPAVEPSRKS
jgi:hypothetical protein